MVLFFQVIIGLLLALIAYNVIHYLFVTRPTQKQLQMGQTVVDQAVNKTLLTLEVEKGALPIRSQAIAKVWGRGVMAFEYTLPTAAITPTMVEFRDQLATKLAEYGRQHHLDSGTLKNNQSVFQVTDVWQLDDKLHFDIAFMINQTTIEYVEDLDRLT